ncbi:hypothetical protein WJX73_005426 [Symbiochloris irregularis]|uniref:Uncharacterized protein n=1 Tax=Symbiochloris irregularis TaxID=706552 RepID=A0AAW1PZ29_9CHLO
MLSAASSQTKARFDDSTDSVTVNAAGAARRRYSKEDATPSTGLQEPLPPDSTDDQGLVNRVLAILAKSGEAIPYAIVASAALALATPQAFTWITSPWYAPLLGYLMFSVGVNLSLDSFVEVFKQPQKILVGSIGQWAVKPAVAWLLSAVAVPAFHLPAAISSGLVLVGAVAGAQLSNYATFLIEPKQAPLAIVLTALSTGAGIVLTPLLALLMLGKSIPIDAGAMALSIAQIVVIPVGAGLACNRLAPRAVSKAKPLLQAGSLLDTCMLVCGSLAPNAAAAKSPLGLQVAAPVMAFHGISFLLGWQLASRTIAKSNVPLARCITLSTGMQSSVLALLLATQFFDDPIVRLTCGLSLIIMTLGGFGLVLWWQRQREATAQI